MAEFERVTISPGLILEGSPQASTNLSQAGNYRRAKRQVGRYSLQMLNKNSPNATEPKSNPELSAQLNGISSQMLVTWMLVNQAICTQWLQKCAGPTSHGPET